MKSPFFRIIFQQIPYTWSSRKKKIIKISLYIDLQIFVIIIACARSSFCNTLISVQVWPLKFFLLFPYSTYTHISNIIIPLDPRAHFKQYTNVRACNQTFIVNLAKGVEWWVNLQHVLKCTGTITPPVLYNNFP